MTDEIIDVIPEPTKALIDLRTSMGTMTVERMEVAMADYDSRRNCFRDWLKSKLVEGVHYGFPPGCEPKYSQDGKHVLQVTRKGTQAVPISQWKPRPSLYKAGADLLCDLLGAIDIYSADMESWQQAGSPPGLFVQKCVLRSRATDEILAEGRGARRTGDKGGDANNAIKMAKKCAKVDAVLNWLGLADLYTQDLEDDPQAPHDNPKPDETAPRAAPRDARPQESIVVGLFETYRQRHPDHDFKQWAAFVVKNCGRSFNIKNPVEWMDSDVISVAAAMKVVEE